jgi:hypothetical protein
MKKKATNKTLVCFGEDKAKWGATVGDSAPADCLSAEANRKDMHPVPSRIGERLVAARSGHVRRAMFIY